MWFFKIKSTALRKKKKDCIFIITGIKRSERLVSCSYWGLTHYSWVRVPCRQVTQSPPLLTGLHPTWFLWAFSAQPRKKEEGPSELSPTLWFNRINERGTSALPIPTNSPQIPMISKILLYSGSDFNTYKTFFFPFFKTIDFSFFRSIPKFFTSSALEVPARVSSSSDHHYSTWLLSPESAVKTRLQSFCFTDMLNKLTLSF